MRQYILRWLQKLDSPDNRYLESMSESKARYPRWRRTEIHDVITTDGAVVHHNVPGPEGDSRPLLHFEPLLSRTASGLSR